MSNWGRNWQVRVPGITLTRPGAVQEEHIGILEGSGDHKSSWFGPRTSCAQIRGPNHNMCLCGGKLFAGIWTKLKCGGL